MLQEKGKDTEREEGKNIFQRFSLRFGRNPHYPRREKRVRMPVNRRRGVWGRGRNKEGKFVKKNTERTREKR